MKSFEGDEVTVVQPHSIASQNLRSNTTLPYTSSSLTSKIAKPQQESLKRRRTNGFLRNQGKVLVDLTSASDAKAEGCLLYTSPSPRDGATSRMPSSA